MPDVLSSVFYGPKSLGGVTFVLRRSLSMSARRLDVYGRSIFQFISGNCSLSSIRLSVVHLCTRTFDILRLTNFDKC